MKIEYTVDCDGVKITQRIDTDGFGVVKPLGVTPAETKNDKDSSQSGVQLGSQPIAQPATDRTQTPKPRAAVGGGEPEPKGTGGGPPGGGLVIVFGPIICVPGKGVSGKGDQGGGEPEPKG